MKSRITLHNKHSISHRYDDIIGLPHHVSSLRSHMSGTERAAQLAPFAALTGHDASIREAAQLTERPAELTEDRKAVLDRVFQYLLKHIKEHPRVTVIYFVPDDKKTGGTYVSTTGRVMKFHSNHRSVIMENQTTVPINSVYDVQLLSESTSLTLSDLD